MKLVGHRFGSCRRPISGGSDAWAGSAWRGSAWLCLAGSEVSEGEGEVSWGVALSTFETVAITLVLTYNAIATTDLAVAVAVATVT